MDKKPEKLVPEVRFKGFTDDWEQHKLDALAKFSKGKGYSKKMLLFKVILCFYMVDFIQTIRK